MRALLVLAASALGVALLALDWFARSAVLAPLACVPLLIIALVAGLRVALPAAIVAAIAFAALERDRSSLWIDAFSLAAAYAICVLLVVFARRQGERKAAIETQISAAKDLHDQLFPARVPRVEAWNVSIIHLPLHEVGGDFYSIEPTDASCSVFVGDVTGKGLRPSMLLSAIKVLIRSSEPGDVGARLSYCNRFLHIVCTDDMFCTGWLGELYADGRVSFAAAGHEPCLIRRCDGTIEELLGGGMPLGMLPESKFAMTSTTLRRGDRLLVYSDGLSELFAAFPELREGMFSAYARAESLIRTSQRRDDVLAIMMEFQGDESTL